MSDSDGIANMMSDVITIYTEDIIKQHMDGFIAMIKTQLHPMMNMKWNYVMIDLNIKLSNLQAIGHVKMINDMKHKKDLIEIIFILFKRVSSCFPIDHKSANKQINNHL